MNELRWGVIGCGAVVERKSGPSIAQAGRSRIVAVMRRDAEKARPFAQAHAVTLVTAEARAVIQHPEVNIVYVATPPSSHLEYVLAAAAAHKHVLVEKPMGLSTGEARRMIAACEEAGVHLFVAYYRRFWPHVQKMRELLGAGRVGRPVLACLSLAAPRRPVQQDNWRDNVAVSGGGYFVDVGSHRLDTLIFLMGAVEEVTGVAAIDAASRLEEAVALSLRFRTGALGAVTADYRSGRWQDRLEIVGTAGALVSDPLDSQKFELRTTSETEEFSFTPCAAPHLGLIRHIESVLLDGVRSESSGLDGLQTEIILDKAVREATRSSGTPGCATTCERALAPGARPN